MFSRKMYGVSLLYTKDHSAAEDVVQESFIRIFQKISQYEGKGAFEGWMRRIVVNTALERFRRQNWLFTVSEVSDYDHALGYEDMTTHFTAADLMTLISDLSPQYRVVFSLYALEGYSHQEIGQKLGISEGTSKSNLSRARKILQEKVERLFYMTQTKMV